MRKAGIVLLMLLALASVSTETAASGAQRRVDETRRASRSADIEIFNRDGSVRVVGWDRPEVRVVGSLGQGVEGLDFDSDGDDVYIGVRRDARVGQGGPESASLLGSELEIHVPYRASVEVDTVSAAVEVAGVEGDITIATVRGGVNVVGGPTELDVETGSGNIRAELTASTREVDLVSGSGLVELSAERSEVSVETVSGNINAVGIGLRDSSFDSTAGSIHFTGDLADSHSYEFNSFNGDITLLLPANVSAAFEASSHAGSIETDFGFEPRATGRTAVGMSLEFEVGGGAAEVTIETFSGSIEIRKS